MKINTTLCYKWRKLMVKKSFRLMSLVIATCCIMQGAYAEDMPASTTFLAHYNNDTGNSGLNADYAGGSVMVNIPDANYGLPSINSAKTKFGHGALNLDYWANRNLVYQAAGNYNSAVCTIEFQLNMSAVFDFNENQNKYLFDGTKRYVFNDDLAWGTGGHVDIWIDGEAESETARLVAHFCTGSSTETLMGPPLRFSDANAFSHYAIQWNASTGKIAIFHRGMIRDKKEVSPWTPTNPASFKIGMNTNVSVGKLILDELRISNKELYNDSSAVGTRSFYVPAEEYKPSNLPAFSSTTLFVAHFNGIEGYDSSTFDANDPNTFNGLIADYAKGSQMVTIPTPKYGVPPINTTIKKFGAGAVELPWWSGRSITYAAQNNYSNAAATIDFQLNIKNIFMEYGGQYVYDGTKRYVFNDDLAWGKSGHVDMWVDGTAGATTARLVVHIQGDRNGSVFTITVMGPPLEWQYAQDFLHYAVQWNCVTGKVAIYCQGIIRVNDTYTPWTMSNSPTKFKLGMQSVNVSPLYLDEFRISSIPLYDNTKSLGQGCYYLPWAEYPIGCQLIRCYGDANNDRETNFLDFSILAMNYHNSVAGGYDQADFDNSGYVDLNDVAILAYYWLEPCRGVPGQN